MGLVELELGSWLRWFESGLRTRQSRGHPVCKRGGRRWREGKGERGRGERRAVKERRKDRRKDVEGRDEWGEGKEMDGEKEVRDGGQRMEKGERINNISETLKSRYL